ncbi:MAG: arginine deiminase-related protein [Pseudomonadota bacterium]
MIDQHESQLASTVLMVRPAQFHCNPLAAVSNAFMQAIDRTPAEEQALAEQEFDGLVAVLQRAAVDVIVVDDTVEPETPDAVFPNNWMSTHADGRFVMYPMAVANRREERRDDIVELLEERGFSVSSVVNLSAHEKDEQFLEGTGSLVLDRPNRIAYACRSARTHSAVLDEFATRFGYALVVFDAVDQRGQAIYHTNVMMNIGESFAVVCLESIPSRNERDAVVRSLGRTGHEIIDISQQQLLSMAGNMLELRSRDGQHLLAMSARARMSLSDAQRDRLESYATIVSAPINSIEESAGGSVRCMLAEIHLPETDAHD